MAVTKEIIEIKDGPEREKQKEELFSKGFAVVQETPDKVVMIKFTPDTRKIKMTKESLTVGLHGIQLEVLNISDKLCIIEKPFKDKNTYCSFKMTVTHTQYGWTENNTTHEELDIPYELNDKILSMVKDFYTEKKKELDKKRNELIDRYVEDLKQEKATTENIYLSEKDKKEVCWKCRRFNNKSMNICQNYEEGVKCRIWFDDNGNRIDGVGRDCL